MVLKTTGNLRINLFSTKTAAVLKKRPLSPGGQRGKCTPLTKNLNHCNESYIMTTVDLKPSEMEIYFELSDKMNTVITHLKFNKKFYKIRKMKDLVLKYFNKQIYIQYGGTDERIEAITYIQNHQNQQTAAYKTIIIKHCLHIKHAPHNNPGFHNIELILVNDNIDSRELLLHIIIVNIETTATAYVGEESEYVLESFQNKIVEHQTERTHVRRIISQNKNLVERPRNPDRPIPAADKCPMGLTCRTKEDRERETASKSEAERVKDGLAEQLRLARGQITTLSDKISGLATAATNSGSAYDILNFKNYKYAAFNLPQSTQGTTKLKGTKYVTIRLLSSKQLHDKWGVETGDLDAHTDKYAKKMKHSARMETALNTLRNLKKNNTNCTGMANTELFKLLKDDNVGIQELLLGIIKSHHDIKCCDDVDLKKFVLKTSIPPCSNAIPDKYKEYAKKYNPSSSKSDPPKDDNFKDIHPSNIKDKFSIAYLALISLMIVIIVMKIL
jgi:hypothetical protein